MNDTELLELLNDLESDRVERKSAWKSSREKIRQAICAFANDLPNHQLPGVLFVGVDDDGNPPIEFKITANNVLAIVRR